MASTSLFSTEPIPVLPVSGTAGVFAASCLTIAVLVSAQTWCIQQDLGDERAKLLDANRALAACRIAEQSALERVAALQVQLGDEVVRMAAVLPQQRSPLIEKLASGEPLEPQTVPVAPPNPDRSARDNAAELARLEGTLSATRAAMAATRTTVGDLQDQLGDASKTGAPVPSRRALLSKIDGVRKAMKTLARRSELRPLATKAGLGDVVRRSELDALVAERRTVEARIALLSTQLETAPDAQAALASKAELRTVLVGLMVKLWTLESQVTSQMTDLAHRGSGTR